jgi:hypothetical protein
MVTRMESVKTNLELGGRDSLADLVARFDNDHCKVEDLQNMVQSCQQRLEHLFETIRNMEHAVFNMNVVEESHNLKIVDSFNKNYLNEVLESVRFDLGSLAQMQQEGFGFNNQRDPLGKPENKSNPFLSNSHISSPLGFNRPKEKVDGPIFKNEISEKNLVKTKEVGHFDSGQW